MNEYELKRALAGHAADVHPTLDLDRIQAAMVRTDRFRVARTTGVAALLSTVVVLSIFAAQGGEAATPLDIVDSPSVVPEPGVDFPVLDDATDESATTTQAPPTTTLAPLAEDPTPHAEDPSHLAPPSSTTPAPAVVASTTTAPPPTTAPPTTTPAPTTTVPPITTVPPTTTTAPTLSFFASARYGSCAEDPPFDEYSGTAAPGATITFTSPWNATATTTADGGGNWFHRVEFPFAPVGVVFQVTVTDGSDTTSFNFIRTA